MPSFLWSSLLVAASQVLPVFSLAIDRSFNASVDAQATLLQRQDPPYWLADIPHQGVAAFNPDSAYQVFRNVKDYGAKGDGVTDDTAAINAAISAGTRCAPGSCVSSSISPAVVYFPAGTYLLSSSIIDYYYTQLIGNPNSLPTLKGTANFQGLGLIDGDLYSSVTGNQDYESTNVFYRQVRNLIFDTTLIPGNIKATGIHWPTSQATSLHNCVFHLNQDSDSLHRGVFIENGSGGFLSDLTFYGGGTAAQLGNQQFTMRGLTFHNSIIAIDQLWDWGWTYKSISFNNCGTGIRMNAGGRTAQTVGSVTLIDSTFTNVQVGILTAYDSSSQPATAGGLILENVQLNNVPTAVQGPEGTALAGTTDAMTIAAWGEGHEYIPSGPNQFQSSIIPFPRPAALLSGLSYYERSKPQYEGIPVSQFVSLRTSGAKGDGITDDTAVINSVLSSAAAAGKVVFFDAGIYKVSSTVFVPAGSKIVGETYPLIMGSGSYFSDMSNPQAVVRVGNSGDSGSIEWSDMIVSTQGATAGAILIEWNLASSSSTPSGMWDVHVRVGGFIGSNLQYAQCPANSAAGTPINTNCIAAYMSMHVTSSATGLYMENVWIWTADHDMDDPGQRQITIHNGRGLYIESGAGILWLVGTAAEHHAMYQYQFANTQNIFMGQIQTETPYYQPNPVAPGPFTVVPALNDPDFAASCAGKSGNCATAWGLRVLNSHDVLVYGAGLYSFFSDYSTACSNGGSTPESCQNSIFSMEGSFSNIDVYNLNTIGAASMIDEKGSSVAKSSDNVNVYGDGITLFKSN